MGSIAKAHEQSGQTLAPPARSLGTRPEGPDRRAKTANGRAPRHRLFPREHGAYGQLGLPLLTAHLLGEPSVAGWSFTFAASAAFMAHEPLLVLLGRRGARARREAGRSAKAWLSGASAAAVAGGVLGALTSPTWIWSHGLWVPLALTLSTVALLVLDRERSALGEALIGLALPSLAIPVALAGRVPLERALGVWFVWSVVSVSGMLGVRAVIGHHKAPRAAAHRVAGPAAALAATGIALGAGVLTLAETLAAVLPTVMALGLAASPPHPRHLRGVGWGLLVASLMATVILGSSGCGSAQRAAGADDPAARLGPG